MAISYIATSGTSGATGTEPTGTAAGDLMICNVLSTSTPVAPVGSPWMPLGAPQTANGYTVIHYWMIRGTSAPSYTWTGMAGANDGVTIATFRGVNSAPIEAYALGAAGSAVMPSMNPSASSDWLICSYGDASATSVTAPSGMTLIDGNLGCLAYQNLGSAAATGTKTWGATSLPVGGMSIIIQYVSTNAVAPIYPKTGFVGPRSVRRKAPKYIEQYPELPVIQPVPPVFITQPKQARPAWRMRPTRRGTAVAPVPPQLNPPRLPDRVLRPWRWWVVRRGTSNEPILSQAVAPPPPYPIQSVLRPWRTRPIRRGAVSPPTPPQLNPPKVPDRVRAAWRTRPLRRGTASMAAPPQLNPLRLPDRVRPAWRYRIVRKGTAATVTPPQERPSEPVERTRPYWRARIVRAGRAFQAAPPQANPPRLPDRVLRPWRWWVVRRGVVARPFGTPPPPIVLGRGAPRRTWQLWARRRSIPVVVPVQERPAQTPSRHAPHVEAHRTRVSAGPPVPQAAPPAQAAVQEHTPRRRLIGVRRARHALGQWIGVARQPLGASGVTTGAAATAATTGPGATGATSGASATGAVTGPAATGTTTGPGATGTAR